MIVVIENDYGKEKNIKLAEELKAKCDCIDRCLPASPFHDRVTETHKEIFDLISGLLSELKELTEYKQSLSTELTAYMIAVENQKDMIESTVLNWTRRRKGCLY